MSKIALGASFSFVQFLLRLPPSKPGRAEPWGTCIVRGFLTFNPQITPTLNEHVHKYHSNYPPNIMVRGGQEIVALLVSPLSADQPRKIASASGTLEYPENSPVHLVFTPNPTPQNQGSDLNPSPKRK